VKKGEDGVCLRTRAHGMPAKSSRTRSIVFADGYAAQEKFHSETLTEEKKQKHSLCLCVWVFITNCPSLLAGTTRLTFDILGFDIKMKERAQETIFFTLRGYKVLGNGRWNNKIALTNVVLMPRQF
jgi:hypothetical protein